MLIVQIFCWARLIVYPVSTLWTRVSGVVLLLTTLARIFVIVRRMRVLRNTYFGVLGLALLLVLSPARNYDAVALNIEFLKELRRYEGTRYVWGGESRFGIDCSGLVRCGLMNALVKQGVLTFNGGLIRSAIAFWWNDCTAGDFSQGDDELTALRFKTQALESFDRSQLVAGDLAANRVHVMVYIGDDQWIEADPNAAKVIVTKTTPQLLWFREPMHIVRLQLLQK